MSRLFDHLRIWHLFGTPQAQLFVLAARAHISKLPSLFIVADPSTNFRPVFSYILAPAIPTYDTHCSIQGTFSPTSSARRHSALRHTASERLAYSHRDVLLCSRQYHRCDYTGQSEPQTGMRSYLLLGQHVTSTGIVCRSCNRRMLPRISHSVYLYPTLCVSGSPW